MATTNVLDPRKQANQPIPATKPAAKQTAAPAAPDARRTIQSVTTGAPATAATTQAPAAAAPAAIPPAPPTPVQSVVDPKTETMQGQIESITAKGSPLMQLAGTRAKQAANQRGLLNTSMAVQAGEAAVLDAALPIASHDATTFARNRELNTATENQFRLEVGLQKIGNENQKLLQSSQNAAAIFQTHSQAVSAIMANPDIPLPQKAALVEHQNELLRSGLAVAGSITNTDFSGLLDFKPIKAGTPKVDPAENTPQPRVIDPRYRR